MVLRRSRNLARTAAHTAVAAKTINAVGNSAARKQAAAPPLPVPDAAPAAAPAAPAEDLISKIERLAALHQSGAITDEEFALLKARELE
ncbi:SHOCT domain-containing protein [Specibacter cremeus]|uniref:SHOCT domain-containing protein n=1 Tax=Specibacter cremeus TaxID=1629051 RepID=UPI000F7A3233|nr:SHOCT domain-containing protein [Specibacter cremeus]